MLKVKSVVIVLMLGCLMPPAAHAETTICNVEADTYMLHGHGLNYGYPGTSVSKAASWVGCEALFRFDLTPLADLTADDVVKAEFHVYTGEVADPGMMDWPVAPAGTTQQAQVLTLRTWGDNHPYKDDFPEFPYWTEAEVGGYADVTRGGINGSTESPNIYDPGDVGGVDPYHYQQHGLNPGTPSTILSHSTGPNTWATVDLTDFVKAWLPGGGLDIANNGIRVHDLGGWSGAPDPEFLDDYDYGWYFFTKDVDGSSGPGSPAHPGWNYVPYLKVDAVPEPSTIVLLGMAGLLALLTMIRRRRKACDA